MIDTHAHLDACTEDADELVTRARGAGVNRVIAIGSGIESCATTLAIAERNEGVFASLGIHPHQAGGAEADRIGELRTLLEHVRVVAVGETGLDFFRDYAPREAQRRLFETQLDLAAEFDLPVVVHNRSADEETLGALENFAGTVVLHCFSSVRLLPAALERGYYVSFAGNVSFPNARDLRLAATQVPSDRLLVETDSPYLAPQPVRGRPNEPANVVHTVAALAEARAESADELAARVDANASAAFSLP